MEKILLIIRILYINLKPAGGGRAWGGDLIVIVVPGVGLLTDLAFPGRGYLKGCMEKKP